MHTLCITHHKDVFMCVIMCNHTFVFIAHPFAVMISHHHTLHITDRHGATQLPGAAAEVLSEQLKPSLSMWMIHCFEVAACLPL